MIITLGNYLKSDSTATPYTHIIHHYELGVKMINLTNLNSFPAIDGFFIFYFLSFMTPLGEIFRQSMFS